MKVRFLRLSYFLWVLLPLGLWFVAITYGSPHLRWSYSWRDEGQGYDPHAGRYYMRCSYIGLNSTFTIHPMNGQCAFIRFQRKAGSER